MWIFTIMGEERLPSIGFGTYDVFDHSEIIDAIDIGYRLIDTAEWYDNEDIVGRAVSETSLDRERR
jgi:2,5-diketo-D-gluconate reductase B